MVADMWWGDAPEQYIRWDKEKCEGAPQQNNAKGTIANLDCMSGRVTKFSRISPIIH